LPEFRLDCTIFRDRQEEKVQIVNSHPRQEFELDISPDPSPQYDEVKYAALLSPAKF
jgi:hypothetical protein